MAFITTALVSQADQVSVVYNDDGVKLVVNGEDFMMNGMNWDYIPIGTNTVNAQFWEKSDDISVTGKKNLISQCHNTCSCNNLLCYHHNCDI